VPSKLDVPFFVQGRAQNLNAKCNEMSIISKSSKSPSHIANVLFGTESQIEGHVIADEETSNATDESRTQSRLSLKTEGPIQISPAPRENAASKSRRKHISSSLRKHIWSRDQGRCQQCSSTRFLEIDHKIPLAQGGSDRTDNLGLLCRSCNQRAAIEKLGQTKMQKYFDRDSTI
jgi:hypothetical protein